MGHMHDERAGARQLHSRQEHAVTAEGLPLGGRGGGAVEASPAGDPHAAPERPHKSPHRSQHVRAQLLLRATLPQPCRAKPCTQLPPLAPAEPYLSDALCQLGVAAASGSATPPLGAHALSPSDPPAWPWRMQGWGIGAAPATVGLGTESLAGWGAWRGEKYVLGCATAPALLCMPAAESGVAVRPPAGPSRRRRSEADCAMSHCSAEKDAGTCSCRRTTPDGPRLLLWCSTCATARCRLATASWRVACTACRWGPGGHESVGRR